MKKKITSFFLVLLLIFVLSGCSGAAEPRYILTRYTTKFEPNTGFLEPEQLRPETWTSMTHESFENGTVTDTVSITRSSGYTLEFTDASGETVTERLSLYGGGGSSYEYGEFDLYQEARSGEDYDEATCQGRYYWDEEGRLKILETELVVAMSNQKGEPLQKLRFSYDDNGNLTRQDQWLADETHRYRLYTYDDNTDLSRVEQYNAQRVLESYTQYSYDYLNQIQYEKTYTADGELIDITTMVRGPETDIDGYYHILRVETSDGQGNPVSRVSYSYDKPPVSPVYMGMGVLVVIAIGFFIFWQIRLAMRNRNYKKAPTIEVRAKLVSKSTGSSAVLTDGTYFGTFQSEGGEIFELAMQREHYALLPEEVWGIMQHKGGWMLSFYSDEEERK